MQNIKLLKYIQKVCYLQLCGFLYKLYTDSKKSCQSLEDCGELHENEASQVVVFSQEIDK